MSDRTEEVVFWIGPGDANHILAEWTRPGGNVPDDAQSPAEVRVTSRDMTHDPDRAALEAHLVRNTRRAQRRLEVVAVLVAELDDFHDVIDFYGADVGGEVLRFVGQRLDAVRGATAYQLYGEIFVVIAGSLRSRFDALGVAERIQRRLSQPFSVEGCEVALSACIGVRVSLDGARDPAELVLDAAFALDEAKQRGRGETVLFAEELRIRSLRQRPDPRGGPSGS